MLLCLLIKSHSRSELALLFFSYKSTIITTTIITTIADSVRRVSVTIIQASALFYDVITYDVIKLLALLEQGLLPCCPPCKMNLVTLLATHCQNLSACAAVKVSAIQNAINVARKVVNCSRPVRRKQRC